MKSLILLCLAALSAAQASISWTLSSPSITEGSTATIAFRLAAPITCADSSVPCGVTVRLNNELPQFIALSACHVHWSATEFQQVRVITVSAVENFINTEVLAASIAVLPAESADAAYNGVDATDVQIELQSVPSGLCSMVTDPHVLQFDGGLFVDLTPGTFVLWSAPARNFEVQVRVNSLGRVCGLAVQDSCDFAWIDRCSGSPVIRTSVNALDGASPVVFRTNNGTSFVVRDFILS